MELTRKAIKKYSSEIDGLKDYLIVVNEIEDNIDSGTDISIDASKALIEGLLKKTIELLDDEYSTSKHVRNKTKTDFSYLITRSSKFIFEEGAIIKMFDPMISQIYTLSRLNNLIRGNVSKLVNLNKDTINCLIKFRDEKGDISHGKLYPKESYSTKHLLNSIVSITDAIASYIVIDMAEKYSLKKKEYDERDELSVYGDNSEYNYWLNLNNPDFYFKKPSFSRLLFEHDPVAYRQKYYDEYSTIKLEDTNVDNKISAEEQTVVEKDVVKPKENYLKPVIFDDNVEQLLREMIMHHNLSESNFREIIDNYLRYKIFPEYHHINEIYQNKLKLNERKIKIEQLKVIIISFLKSLDNQ